MRLGLLDVRAGVALLPVVGAAVPFSIGTGTGSPIVAALVLAVFLLAAWVAAASLAREFRIAKSPLNAPLVAVGLVWVIAYLYSNVERPPLVRLWPGFPMAQLGGLGVVLVSLGVLVLAANTGRDVRWVQLATWSFLGTALIAAAAFYLGLHSAMGVIETGGLFTMWTVSLAYSQALFNERLPGWLRVGLVLLVAVWVYKAVALQTWWFSGWLPALVTIAVITFFRSKRAFAVLAVLGVAALTVHSSEVYDAVWGGAVKKGDLTRLDIWEQTWQLVQAHPVLGVGPAGYAVYFMSFDLNSGRSMSTHSNYLDIVAQTGFIGAALFAWLLMVLFLLGWRARRRWRSGFLGGYAQGAFAGFVGLLVAMSQGDWFTPFVYNQTIAGFRYTVHSWVFLGLLSSLALLRNQRTGRLARQD
jgi:O-antigen ligase